MKGVIRLGDPTTHGGKVIGAAGRVQVMGKTVARVGDLCTCPVPGHGMCVIVEGHPHVKLDGVAVAFDGHRTSCGAALMSTTTVAQAE